MKYECITLTPEAFKARQEWIEKMITEELGDDSKKGYKKMFLRLDYIGFLNRIDDDYENIHLIPEEIVNPETYTQEFNPEEKGYQSQPRIMWEGEIQKIDDIDEIIEFRRVKNSHHYQPKPEDVIIDDVSSLLK